MRSRVLLAVLVGLAGCGGSSSSDPGPFQHGMNLTAFEPEAFSSPESDKALLALGSLGVDHVAIVVTWYQDTGDGYGAGPDGSKTPSDQSILDAMERARNLGIKVMIKPQIDVRDGTFRGELEPSDRNAWFKSYSGMLARYSDIAQKGGADLFLIGTELTSLSGEEQRWRDLIKEVRQRFKGELSFAANWHGGVEKVKFWDDLDYIGIDAYYPLSEKENPSVQDLVDGWQKPKHEIEKVHERYDKPVLFPEIGYEALAGTAIKPYGGAPGAPSDEAQANAYEAACRVWNEPGWFAGLYWWEWSAVAQPSTYDPAGRPAEDLVRRCNQSR